MRKDTKNQIDSDYMGRFRCEEAERALEEREKNG